MKKTFEFSLKIIKYCKFLVSKKEFAIADQLLKSGTSIGANVFEAQNAESKLDFVHKMKIASKEASESLYWLMLCEKLDGLEVQEKTIADLKEIIAIISRIIITCKKYQ